MKTVFEARRTIVMVKGRAIMPKTILTPEEVNMLGGVEECMNRVKSGMLNIVESLDTIEDTGTKPANGIEPFSRDPKEFSDANEYTLSDLNALCVTEFVDDKEARGEEYSEEEIPSFKSRTKAIKYLCKNFKG